MVWQDHHPVRFILDHEVFSISHVSSSSAAKLAYQDAQRVIDGKPLGEALVDAAHGASRIEKDINILQSLASKLRARRFQDGALSLEVLSLAFKLDENGLPIDCGQYKRTEANYLVEEVGDQSICIYDFANNLFLQFMLLSNISIAQHIAVHLPEQALLRRHDIPLERRLVRTHYP